MRKPAVSVWIGLVAMCLAVTACSSTAKPTAGATVNPTTTATSTAVTSATSATMNAPVASSSTSRSAGSNGSLDVCSLLSAAQASSLNSVTYAAGQPKHVADGYDVCTYPNTGKHSSPIDIQALTVTVASLASCWTSFQHADGPGTNIAGLGDAAFGYGIGIVVKAGNRCLKITGLTAAEFHGNYRPDSAMAKKILAGLR